MRLGKGITIIFILTIGIIIIIIISIIIIVIFVILNIIVRVVESEVLKMGAVLSKYYQRGNSREN